MTLRKKMVMLRKVLEIPEVKMCSNKWSEINFEKIASLCLSRNSRAFLDEDKSGKIRHPEDEVRKLCRENLIESLKKGVNGSQLNPNELVEKIYKENISPAIAAVANCQWDSMFKNIQEQIQKRINEVGSSNFDLTKCVVMSDVSGSMAGTPMMVSIGFGILVSQLSHDAFKDLVMTFDDNPVFHNLKDKLTFVDKVKHLERAPWGSSTNFEKAMNLIIKIIEKNKLKENDIPQSLLVISDMQFNDATGGNDYLSEERGSGWGTAFDNIKNMFKKLGERLYGHSINPPQIIFWNVRADTIGYPAGADEPGVTLLSGYSPALLKFIFSGELEEEVEVVDENGETRKVKVKLSPKETLQKILSEKALDPVRVIVDKL
jgi:Mg-chelatase subunit ChlD